MCESPLIDCHSKKVIGWATGNNYKTALISAAIDMAVRNHMIAPQAIFHSDRGSNYTSTEFAATLAEHFQKHHRASRGTTYPTWDLITQGGQLSSTMAESGYGET